MKFMCFQWRAFSQDDLEDALKAKGIELGSFSYQFSGIQEDDYFLRHFSKALKNGGYDAVISWNFWPLVAQACYDQKIPYIAWEYDCPISYQIVPWVLYPTSYVFFFDRAECEKYEKKGAPHVYHYPLAVNTRRIDQLELTKEEQERFTCDISFLGTMYESSYAEMSRLFTEYERGYVEAAMAVQRRHYALPLFSEVLSERFLDPLMNKWNEQGFAKVDSMEALNIWMQELLGKHVTRKDRIELISRLGKKYDTRYYSYHRYEEIDGAVFAGPLNYREEMFKMFRQSKINLNITFRLITKGIPLRALDIMAAGGFLLSNWQEDLALFFQPGIDFACYENIEQAEEMADYYLSHEDERLKMAENGHKAVKVFDYSVQLQGILDIVFPNGQKRQSKESR